MKTIHIVHFLRNRIRLHLLFWAVFACTLAIPYIGKNNAIDWLDFGIQLLVYLVLIYYFFLFVYKPLSKGRNWIIFMAVFFIILFLCSFMYAHFFGMLKPDTKQEITWMNFFPFYFMLSCLAGLLKFSKDMYLRLYREGEERAKLLKQRLDYLTWQIQPHFLFNTLSNFYGLALRKSDELPSLMLKLSGIMRYMTYNSSCDFIPVTDEAAYLSDYAKLECIRFDDSLQFDLQFDLPPDSELKIAPMLFFVLLENAFKHVKKTSSGPMFVCGTFWVNNLDVGFELKNSFTEPTDIENNQHFSGFGLKNLADRLRILYPEKHHFEYKQEEGYFHVSLKIRASL